MYKVRPHLTRNASRFPLISPPDWAGVYAGFANFDFVGGVYFYDGEACGVFGTVLPMYLAALGGVTVDNGGCVQTDSYAIYGQGNYKLSDALTLTVGGRFTKDEKEADVYRATYLGVHFINAIDPDS